MSRKQLHALINSGRPDKPYHRTVHYIEGEGCVFPEINEEPRSSPFANESALAVSRLRATRESPLRSSRCCGGKAR